MDWRLCPHLWHGKTRSTCEVFPLVVAGAEDLWKLGCHPWAADPLKNTDPGCQFWCWCPWIYGNSLTCEEVQCQSSFTVLTIALELLRTWKRRGKWNFLLFSNRMQIYRSQPTYFIYNWPFIGVVGDTRVHWLQMSFVFSFRWDATCPKNGIFCWGVPYANRLRFLTAESGRTLVASDFWQDIFATVTREHLLVQFFLVFFKNTVPAKTKTIPENLCWILKRTSTNHRVVQNTLWCGPSSVILVVTVTGRATCKEYLVHPSARRHLTMIRALQGPLMPRQMRYLWPESWGMFFFWGGVDGGVLASDHGWWKKSGSVGR